MRLKLYESGIRNMREIAKNYNKAWIYFHIDLDGVTSAIAMKEYLKQYGIATENAVPMQYGEMEYAIKKTPNGTLPILVDFSHGKIFIKIHTDHHDSQISYNTASNSFKHSKSNAGTISTQISPTDIFSKEDVRVIDMIDSAGYAEENIGIEELKNYLFNYNKGKTKIENHLRFGMVVGKLLLAYKNKPGYLTQIVLNSKPSLMSMFQIMRKIVKENGWADMKQLQKNSEWYAKNQEENKIPEGDIDSIANLSNGQNTLVGNTIVQIGGGNTRKSGAYDRYTAFKLYPEAKYFVMIWDTIGMIQVAKNNWNKENRTKDSHHINLGELVIGDVFNKKYSQLLNKKIYDISLLAIKKTLENKIEKEGIEDALGFDYDELKALFGELPNVSDKQKAFIEKAMKLKPQELIPDENDSEKRKQFKEKVIKFLNDFTIPLPEIIMKTSGGHPGITNLTGFQFLQTQRRIFGALKGGRNPYAPLDPNWKPDPNKPKKESPALQLMKSIACDVVKLLNKDNQIINYWKNNEGEDPVYNTLFESVEEEPYPVGYKFTSKHGAGDMEVTHIDKIGDNKLYRVRDLEPTELWICQGDSCDSPTKKIVDFHSFSVSKEWIDYNKGEEIKSPEDEGDWIEESNQLNENYEQWGGDDTEIIGVGETNSYIYKDYKIYTTASYDEYDEYGDDLVVYYASISLPDGNEKMFSDEIWMDLCHSVTRYIDNLTDDESNNIEEPKDDGNWIDESTQLNETKPARYSHHLGKDKSFANISASRSNALYEPVEGDTEEIDKYKRKKKEEQDRENNRRTKQLMKDIKALGLSYVKTYGAWHEQDKTTKEKSFLIPDITREQALELGKKYGQYSIIFKDKEDDTAYMLITLDNENFGNVDGKFDMSGKEKFTHVDAKDDELQNYTGYTGLKPNGHGYNLSYKWKD